MCQRGAAFVCPERLYLITVNLRVLAAELPSCEGCLHCQSPPSGVVLRYIFVGVNAATQRKFV